MIWIVVIWICRDVLDWLRCKKKKKLVGPLPQRGEDENEKADAKGGQAEKLIIYLTVAKKICLNKTFSLLFREEILFPQSGK